MAQDGTIVQDSVFLPTQQEVFLPVAPQDSTGVSQDSVPEAPLPVIVYDNHPKQYRIAGIKVTGATNYEDFVLIGFSGLSIGDEISIPGDQITNAIKRFWKQGLFSDVKILATKIEDGQAWL